MDIDKELVDHLRSIIEVSDRNRERLRDRERISHSVINVAADALQEKATENLLHRIERTLDSAVEHEWPEVDLHDVWEAAYEARLNALGAMMNAATNAGGSPERELGRDREQAARKEAVHRAVEVQKALTDQDGLPDEPDDTPHDLRWV